MLLTLFRLTEKLTWFHEACRRVIVAVELPLIRLFLKGAGAVTVEARHSLKQPGLFNVFVSDIDLTVSAGEQDFQRIYEVAKGLKRLLRNLGEIEFLLPEERVEFRELIQSPHARVWEKLYSIRKLSWQARALQRAESGYEVAKHRRGLEQTLKKLCLSSPESFLDAVFPELLDRSAAGTPPASAFLEREITFSHPGTAMFFWTLLPDSPQHPEDAPSRALKRYIIRREILLTLVDIRSLRCQGKFGDLSTKASWISLLQKREQELGYF